MKIKQLIFVFIIVLVAGYSGFWLYQASNGKGHIAEKIQKLNDKNKDLFQVHYDTIEAAGFPFSFQFNIVKPVLEVRKQAPVQAISIDGTLELSRPVFAKNTPFTAASNDKAILQTEIGQFIVKGEHSVLFDRQTVYSYTFSDLEILAKNNDDLEEFLKIEQGILDFDNASTSSNYEIDVDFLFKDAIIQIMPPSTEMAEYVLLQQAQKILEKESGDKKNDLKGHVKIRAEKAILDFPLEGESQVWLQKPVPAFSVTLDVETKSTMGSAEYTYKVSCQEDDNKKVSFQVLLASASEVTKKWSEEVSIAIDTLAESDEFLQIVSESFPYVHTLLKNHKELIKELVPDLSSVGKNIFDFDLTLTFDKESGTWSCSIPKLLYKNDDFGSKLVLDVTQSVPDGSPDVVGAISIKNTDALLDAAIGYLNKVIAVYNGLQQDDQQLGEISTRTKQVIEKSLKKVGNKKKQILTFSFFSKDGNKEIAQMSPDEFLEALLPLYFLILQDISQQNNLMF